MEGIQCQHLPEQQAHLEEMLEVLSEYSQMQSIQELRRERSKKHAPWVAAVYMGIVTLVTSVILTLASNLYYLNSEVTKLKYDLIHLDEQVDQIESRIDGFVR